MSYLTGNVYKIICKLDSDIVYIGSTFDSLQNRWRHHKGSYKEYLNGRSHSAIYPYFEKFGIENFKIIQIKQYKCYRENMSDRRHLNVYEQLWINKTRNCVNQKNPFCIKKLAEKYYREKTKDRRRDVGKIYRENNKDKIKEKKKQYRENNKDKIKEKKKQNYEKNKEQLNQRRKELKFCIICKSSGRKNDFKRHIRTKTHIQNAKKVIYNFIISKF